MKYMNLLILFLIAVGGGILNAFSWVNLPPVGPREMNLSLLILQLSGNRNDIVLLGTMDELLNFSIRMIPGYLACIVIGIELYRHFCTAGVYVFSRYTKRLHWYLSELSAMFLSSLVFQVLTVAAVLIVSMIRFHVVFDGAGCLLMVYHILIYTLWLYSMSLLLSTIASYSGSEAAYIFIIGLQTFMIALLSLNNADWGEPFLMINPASRLVLGWYDSTVRLLPYQIRGNSYQWLSFAGSVVLLLAGALMISFITSYLIRHRDILGSNAEIGV